MACLVQFLSLLREGWIATQAAHLAGARESIIGGDVSETGSVRDRVLSSITKGLWIVSSSWHSKFELCQMKL